MYLDATILHEVLLSRSNERSARKLIEGLNDEIFISTLTAQLVTHFGKAIVELPILRAFLGDYKLLSLESSDFEWAFTNASDSDFEDALRLAVAIRNGCEEIITFDKQLAELYKDLLQIKVTLLT